MSFRRLWRVAWMTAFLYVFVTIASFVTMHPAYKNLPTWFVNGVWRPVVVFIGGINEKDNS